MDKRIRESLDQIHAPKSLVDDTIRKMHEVQRGEQINKDVKQWRLKPVMGVVTALAACAVLVIVGINITGITGANNSDTQEQMSHVADLPDDGDVLNGGNISQTDEFLFESVKELSEWKQMLKLMKESGTDTMTLEDDYIVYNTQYQSNGKEYQVQILLEDGCLNNIDGVLVAQGQFKVMVTPEDKNIVETNLVVTSTSQFCDEQVTLVLEDRNVDGQMDFLLETEYNRDGAKTEVWHTIDVSGNVNEIKM